MIPIFVSIIPAYYSGFVSVQKYIMIPLFISLTIQMTQEPRYSEVKIKAEAEVKLC